MDPGACQKEIVHRDEEGMHLMTLRTLQVGVLLFNNSTHDVVQANFGLIVLPKHFMG